ncbi:MAG: polysaccharide biosynthesis tyrosine autokinase [Oscillospiraceae bacterium]
MGTEDTLDLGFLVKTLKKHLAFILIAGVLCGIGSFLVSEFLVTKKYESRAMLYVENNQQTSDSLNINDITAAQKLVNTCQIIFKSDTMLDNLITELDLPYTKEQLDNMITAQSVNSTEVMELVVESTSPEESQRIVNKLVELANVEFNRIIKSGSIEVIDYGEINPKASFPNVMLITAAGAFIGIAAAYVIAFARDMLDVAIKHDDNISKIYDVPVFAEIMEFGSASESKYGYYSYGSNKKKSGSSSVKVSTTDDDKMLTADTPFAITEAYNTARTNIMFAASTSSRKIIAVTSANPSEGKSTTCSNLAISFANAGKKVLLVDCDLRKPVMAKKFKLKPKNGLSEIIGGFCSINEAIFFDVVPNLDIITAGNIPPNPSELLGSAAMKAFLNASSEIYDYVFLDTPPVNVVTDSQLMNGSIAGLVLVIRENSTTHPDIQEALDKVGLANGKALGFIKTFCRSEKTGKYGKYGKYGDKYGYEYSYSNREAERSE